MTATFTVATNRLIGLCGTAGSGKDFVCDYISKSADFGRVQRVALADGVRIEVAEEVFDALGFEAPYGAGIWAKPYTDGQRWILQQWGTEFRRAQDPDYWVNKSLQVVAELHDDDPELIAVITDVRFVNEAEAIREYGGYVVQVMAPDEVRAARLGGKLPPSHASEDIDFTPDYRVINDLDGAPPSFPRPLLGYLKKSYRPDTD